MISSRESPILIVHVCMYDQCTIESGASHGHTGIAARSLHQAGIDHVTTCICRAALLLLQAGVHHADLLRHLRLDRGLHHLFINLLWRLRRRWPTSSVTLAGPGALPRRANLCQHRHILGLSLIRQWVCGSSSTFGGNLSSDRYNKQTRCY